MKEILKQLRKADEAFQLIQDDDVVVVGVSGGKDSMLLTKALALYQKFEHKQFKVIAVHMKMGFPGMDAKAIKTFCESLAIPYYEEEVPIYEILQNYKKDDGSIDCSRCSKLKRGAIVAIAKKLNANKIAFGHHGDDAVETFMLNAIYSGKAQTFQPKIEYEDNGITFIRPLVYLHEQQIMKTIRKEEIPVVASTCPKDGNSQRSHIKQLLNTLYQDFPSAKHNLLLMLNDRDSKLWKNEKEDIN